MRICLFIVFLAGVAFAQDPNYLSQFGITWYFDKAVTTDGAGDTYQYGTFANGDYWIVGPVVIERITPASIVSGDDTLHGTMVNPVSASPTYQGFDSRADYAPTLVWSAELAHGLCPGTEVDRHRLPLRQGRLERRDAPGVAGDGRLRGGGPRRRPGRGGCRVLVFRIQGDIEALMRGLRVGGMLRGRNHAT